MTKVSELENDKKIQLLRDFINKKANCMRQCLYNNCNGNGKPCECCQAMITEFESKDVEINPNYKIIYQ